MPKNINNTIQNLKGKIRLPRKNTSQDENHKLTDMQSSIFNGSSKNDGLVQDAEKSEPAFWGKHKLMLQQVIINGLIGIAEDKLKDDDFIEGVFNKAYEMLPTPVRLVLNRKRCLNYLMDNKTPLLEKIQDYRVGKLSAAELADSLEKSLPLLTNDSIPNPPENK